MSNNFNKSQVVYFSDKITIDEEYTIFMQPEPTRKLPTNPIAGNFALPKPSEYLDPVNLTFQPYDQNHPELYSVLVSIFTCEPFYNLIKRFKERAEYSYDMKNLGLFSDFVEVLTVTRSDRRASLNLVIGKIARIVEQTQVLPIYEEILRLLNSEFLRFYYYKKTGWVIQGDKAFEAIGGKYANYSPISELFVTEMKKIVKKKCIADQFDHFEIKTDCFETELNQRLSRIDIKRPVKRFAPILALTFSGTIALKESFEFGVKTYLFKTAILRDKSVECKAGTYDCVMAFYRVVKIGD